MVSWMLERYFQHHSEIITQFNLVSMVYTSTGNGNESVGSSFLFAVSGYACYIRKYLLGILCKSSAHLLIDYSFAVTI